MRGVEHHFGVRSYNQSTNQFNNIEIDDDGDDGGGDGDSGDCKPCFRF